MLKQMLKSVLLLALLGFAGNAAVITNSGFESVSSTVGFVNGLALNALASTQWDVYSAIPGWSATSGQGIEVQYGSVIAPHTGNFYVELEGDVPIGTPTNSTMQQSFALSAGNYMLSFWYHPRTNTVGDNTIDASLFPAGSPGSPLFTTQAAGISSSIPGWVQITQAFSVTTAGNYTLSFAAVGIDNGAGGFLDDISISSSGIGVIPEPSTYALVGLGLLAAGLARRRFAR